MDNAEFVNAYIDRTFTALTEMQKRVLLLETESHFMKAQLSAWEQEAAKKNDEIAALALENSQLKAKKERVVKD